MLLVQLKRLTKHSAIYGLGALVPRFIGLLLLPLYTRYLSPREYGVVETLLAASALAVMVLRGGISAGFFRYFFDANNAEQRLRLTRTAFWATLAIASIGLTLMTALAKPISLALFGTGRWAGVVRAAGIGVWVQLNYEQMTALFRVRERSTAFAGATLVNTIVTASASVVLVIALDLGPVGVVLGTATGSLVVLVGLFAVERFPLAPLFDRALFNQMNRFGLPLLPSGILLWATYFSDRLLLTKLAGVADVGRYSIAARIASGVLIFLTGFRTAWTAFAYSIEDEGEAKRTYAHVLTYVGLISFWLATGLSVLSPWIVHALTRPAFYEASRAVAPLAFAGAASALYTVVSIGTGRAKRTQRVWLVALVGATVDIALNFLLIPTFGIVGAATASITAYVVMFLAMAWYGQRIYPVPYQWRRIAVLAIVAIGITVIAKLTRLPLAVAVTLALLYPAFLMPLGFYLPEEAHALAELTARIGIGTRQRPRSGDQAS
jgi:O-antigen/teichoic acid export membrane protein